VTRVLAVNAVSHAGGAEVALLRLLRRVDWAVTFTTPGPGPLADTARADGHRVEHVALGGLGRHEGLRAVAAWRRIRRLARGHDAVYLNGTVAARMLPALRRRRTILHVHDIVDLAPRFWRRADVVLAASGAVARNLPGLGAHVVYCPIELDVVPAPEPPWSPGPGPVVGFVGRLERRKGPDLLVSAAPAIRAGAPGARIVIVGDDPYGSDPEYARIVAGAEEVEHVPWTAHAASVMHHFDVLVAPSRQEPFGTVLAEAMAAGTPVVATQVGGLGEVVQDGVTGALVTPEDPDALARGVLAVLARRDELGAAARLSARRFDADAYAVRVAALVEDRR